MYRGFAKNEDGQAAVEFAIIAMVLVLLLTAPIDLYRYAATRSVLNNATTEALSQVTAAELDDPIVLSANVMNTATTMYGDRVRGLEVQSVTASPSSSAVSYDYRVYSSDKQKDADKFEARPSNYSYRTVELSLSCDWKPVTFWGTLLFGTGDITITSDPITRDVFVEGYQK